MTRMQAIWKLLKTDRVVQFFAVMAVVSGALLVQTFLQSR